MLCILTPSNLICDLKAFIESWLAVNSNALMPLMCETCRKGTVGGISVVGYKQCHHALNR